MRDMCAPTIRAILTKKSASMTNHSTKKALAQSYDRRAQSSVSQAQRGLSISHIPSRLQHPRPTRQNVNTYPLPFESTFCTDHHTASSAKQTPVAIGTRTFASEYQARNHHYGCHL